MPAAVSFDDSGIRRMPSRNAPTSAMNKTPWAMPTIVTARGMPARYLSGIATKNSSSVEVPSITHDRCTRLIMAGQVDGAADDWGAILAAWTIVLASAIDPLFPDARGLEFGKNLPNTLAFFLFYVGILAIIWVVGVVAFKCLVPARDAEPSASP